MVAKPDVLDKRLSQSERHSTFSQYGSIIYTIYTVDVIRAEFMRVVDNLAWIIAYVQPIHRAMEGQYHEMGNIILRVEHSSLLRHDRMEESIFHQTHINLLSTTLLQSYITTNRTPLPKQLPPLTDQALHPCPSIRNKTHSTSGSTIIPLSNELPLHSAINS